MNLLLMACEKSLSTDSDGSSTSDECSDSDEAVVENLVGKNLLENLW